MDGFPLHGLLFILIHAAYAQSQSSTASPTSSTTVQSTSLSSTLSTSALPSSNSTSSSTSSTDSTASPTSTTEGDSGSSHDYNRGIVNYYFVFLAVIVCIIGISAFFIWRRKRRMSAVLRNSRDNSLARDVSAWDPARSRRRYWQGRWRSAEVSREEGLNEHGEAPPPYVPKSRDEELADGAADAAAGPAVPLQTLSREQAGLKPPDYTEADVHPTPSAAAEHPPESSAESSAESSSRPADSGHASS